jgi:hypothetical protein
MRITAIILGSLLLTGCALNPADISHDQRASGRMYTPSAAGVLGMDPPVLAGVSRVDLSRDNRQTSAFIGYQQQVTTVYDMRLDDHQMFQDSQNDQYDRHAITEITNVTVR